MTKEAATAQAMRDLSLKWSHSTHGQIAWHSEEDYHLFLKTVEKYMNKK